MIDEKQSSESTEKAELHKADAPTQEEMPPEAGNMESVNPPAVRHSPVDGGTREVPVVISPVVRDQLNIAPDPPEAAHSPSNVELLPDSEAERRIRRMSRRSFVWGAAAVAGTWAGLQWLGTRRFDNNIPWPLRRVLEVNENLSRDLFSAGRL